MTITDATHALASPKRRAMLERPAGSRLRLVDAISRVEPTWVEAVAVVQAVCAQVPDGHAVPSLDAIVLEPGGRISFDETSRADDVAAVSGAGRLLSAILRTGDCPMPLWEAMERARRAPGRVGSARAFGASLTCFPPAQGPQELARYFEATRRAATPTARPATASFSTAALTARAGVLLAAVLLGGVGAGVSLGAYVATRVVVPAPGPSQMAALSMSR
jgi:hypothetical protein